MQTSIFLAKLIGPVLAIIGASILINAKNFRAIAQEFMNSPALVFLMGHIALPAGIAIVLVHNVWTSDWRVLITIIGVLAIIGGAVRILFPKQMTDTGRRLIAKPMTLTIAGGFWLALGLVLSFFGYR